MAGRIDVLYVIERSTPNRIPPTLAHLLEGDVRFHVATLDDGGPLGDALTPLAELHPLGAASLTTLPLIARRLRRLAKAARPRVIHTNGYLPGLATAASLLSLPWLHGRHHNLEHHLTGGARHVWLDRLTNRRASHLLAVSEAVRQTLVEREGVAPKRVSVVHNGVDWSALEPDPAVVADWRGRLGRRPLAVAVGRINPVKDHGTLLRAVVEARRELPTLQLAIAGTGDTGAFASLQQTIAQLGLGDVVTLLGWVDNVSALVASADVFVQSSVDESFGQTVVEAIGLGVPVATTTPGGVCEVVGSHYGSIAPGDATALAAAIVDRLTRGADGRADVDAAAADVRRRFSAESMAAGHLALYRAMC